jgi:PST family polysaccharide transporter
MVIKSVFPLILCAVSFTLLFKKFKLHFKKPSFQEIKRQFSFGLPFFIQQVVVSLYTITVPFVLGIMTNDTTVGIFSVAYTIVAAAQGVVLGPIAQAVYPYINKLVKDDPATAKSFIRKILLSITVLSLLLSALIFYFSGFIINFLAGPEYSNSIPVLRILSSIPFIIGIGNVFGIQWLIPFGKQKQLTKILSIASGLNVILLPVLIFYYREFGAASSMIITETVVTAILFLYVQFNKELRFINISFQRKKHSP